MEIDIDAFANEGILIEGDRLTEFDIEATPGESFTVKLEQCADGVHVRYRDPLAGAVQYGQEGESFRREC